MSSSKKPRFFCNFCGSEVDRNATFCKRCGKFFESVFCPRCGKKGTPDTFRNGCPQCGYAFDGNASNAKNGTGLKYKNANHKHAKTKDDLPIWMILLVIVAFIAIAAFFLFYFRTNIKGFLDNLSTLAYFAFFVMLKFFTILVMPNLFRHLIVGRKRYFKVFKIYV